VRFVKMQGLGNDFVVVDGDPGFSPETIRRICNRRFGIGADGLLAVEPVDAGSVRMRYWNADGSPAEMCGNGLRCVARYAHDRGMVASGRFRVHTPVGEREAHVDPEGSVTVELGPVRVAAAEVDRPDGRSYRSVDVGNPHLVTLVEDPRREPVEVIGPEVECSVPGGANVEFVTVEGPGRLRMRVWERGVGETPACGSGMAAAAAVVRLGSGLDDFEVRVPGGAGRIRFEGDVAWIIGPAEYVFDGDWRA
jgi:diaminopimelate epimerase